MLCVIGCVSPQRFFLFPGASLRYSVAPFGLGSPLFHRYYEGTTTSPVSSRTLAFGGLRTLTAVASFGFIRSRFDAPACVWTLVFRCRPRPVLFSAENWSSPKFTGFPFHAPLPWSWTPVGRSAARPSFVVRRLTLGPRWVNGADSSQLKLSWLVPTALVLAVNASCRPHRRLRMTRFRLRGSTLFPGRISTYWAPSQSFPFTSFCLHVRCARFLDQNPLNEDQEWKPNNENNTQPSSNPRPSR